MLLASLAALCASAASPASPASPAALHCVNRTHIAVSLSPASPAVVSQCPHGFECVAEGGGGLSFCSGATLADHLSRSVDVQIVEQARRGVLCLTRRYWSSKKFDCV